MFEQKNILKENHSQNLYQGLYTQPEGNIYTWYISGIYCQLGDYMLPTTFYKNLKKPLNLLYQVSIKEITLPFTFHSCFRIGGFPCTR